MWTIRYCSNDYWTKSRCGNSKLCYFYLYSTIKVWKSQLHLLFAVLSAPWRPTFLRCHENGTTRFVSKSLNLWNANLGKQRVGCECFVADNEMVAEHNIYMDYICNPYIGVTKQVLEYSRWRSRWGSELIIYHAADRLQLRRVGLISTSVLGLHTVVEQNLTLVWYTVGFSFTSLLQWRIGLHELWLTSQFLCTLWLTFF